MGGNSARLALPGLDRPAENIPMVQAALRARMTAVQQGCLRLVDANDNLVESGPLFDLLCRRPNLQQHIKDFLGVLEGQSALWDMLAFAKVNAKGDAATAPDELVPLTPQFLIPIRGVHQPTGTLVPVQWVYIDPWTGQSRMYQPDAIVVRHGFNPHAPLAGLSPLSAGRRVMQFSIGAMEANLGIFLNGGVPDIAWVTDKQITPEQADELLRKIQDKFAGFGNAHKPMIAYNGLKPEKLGFAPSEMQFLEALRLTDQQILMVMRVMPAMVGLMTGETGLSQGSSTDEQWLNWWQNFGLAELDLLAMALQDGVVDRHEWTVRTRAPAAAERRALQQFRARTLRRPLNRGGIQVWFDDAQIPALVKHRLGKLEQHVKLTTVCGYRPDDIRDFLDIGLPDHPTNVGLIPFSVQPVTELVAAGAPAPATKPAVPAAETEQELEATGHAMEVLARALAAPAVRSHEAQRRKFQGLVSRHTTAGARKISGFFVEQRGRVLERLKTARSASGIRADLIDAIFPAGEENAALVKRLLGAWTEALGDGWQLLQEQTGGDHPFTIEDRNIKAALERRKIQGAAMNDTTAGDLRKLLAEAIEAGDSPAMLGDRIAEYYARQIGETSARPQTAARTQMAGLVNDGQMAAAREAGDLRKIWIHGNPEESRPQHEEAERRYAGGIGLDEPFVINGSAMDAPGDASAPVGETANCTCMVGFKPA